MLERALRAPDVLGRGQASGRLSMDILDTHVDPASDVFLANHARMTALVADLRERTLRVKQGGGAKYVERHRAQGKLPVRERIDRLLDAGSPFLELSALAAWDVYDTLS